MGSTFERETAVEAVGDGRYRTDLGPGWNLNPLPQGGIITALALRAMGVELDDAAQRLRTLHTVFAGQVAHGPLEVDVEVLRRGRSMSHLRAEVRNPGVVPGKGHTTTAVFGRTREGFEFTDAVMPEVRRPLECPSFADPPPPGVDFDFDVGEVWPFWTRTEGRPALGQPPWDDSPRTTSLQASWRRFTEPPLLADGALDPLAIVVLCDTMPGAVGQLTGPGREWFGPSVDLTVHLFGPATTEWLLAVNRARRATDGYASVDLEMWTEGGELVAYATQQMFFAFAK